MYWFTACELVVALWSLLLLFIASSFSGRVLRLNRGAQPGDDIAVAPVTAPVTV